MDVKGYLTQITEPNHIAGGGSVASLNGALSASLIMKAYNMLKKKDAQIINNLSKDFYKELLEFQTFFYDGIKNDGEAFGKVLEAWKLPKSTYEEIIVRKEKVSNALKEAVLSPLSIMENLNRLMFYIDELSKYTDEMIDTELVVAKNQIKAGLNSAIINLNINLSYLKDEKFIIDVKERLKKISQI